MKKIFLAALLSYSVLAFGQPAYLVGTGQESIEPDKSEVSLVLGGFAAPGEGRFSLQWTGGDTVSSITAISGSSDRLFIVSKGVLLWKNLSFKDDRWENGGGAENISAIAALDNKLFAATRSGELLAAEISGRIRFKKLSSINQQFTCLTSSGSKLYAINVDGGILSANPVKGMMNWVEFTPLQDVISLAGNNGKLYGLTSGGMIYQCEPGNKNSGWIKIAYKNNITIREDIRLITIAANTIFGVSSDNRLFSGEHRSEGNLSARAMAIKYNDNTAVILGVDIVGLPGAFTGLLKQELLRKHGLPPSAVFINSTHTHFAPLAQNWDTWAEHNQKPDSIFVFSTVKNGILKAVDEALASMKPARLYFGRGKTDIGFNRSLGEHPELYDSSVDVLKVSYSGSDNDSYLFLASCHPVRSTTGSLHYTISANYPGAARQLLEYRTRTTNSIFLQGTCGDINPKDNGEYITGEKLCNEVISVLNRPMTEITGEITSYLDTIDVKTTHMTAGQLMAFRDENKEKPDDLGSAKNVRWANLMLNNYKEGKVPSTMPVYVNTINIGNWKLVGFSRETTTPYSFGVKNLWPGKLVSVAGYTNDVSSYLPSSLHIDAKNYEGLDSFYWYGVNPFERSVYETIMQKIETLQR